MAKAKVVKWAPRTMATHQLWEAANRAWLLRDHPADCPVCAGTNDPDKIVRLHAAHQAALIERDKEAAARRKAASEAYYVGGFKMVVDGAPMRLAAHVAKWKGNNRKMLGQGSDHYGLTLRPHNKNGFTDDKPRPSRLNYVACKELGECEGISAFMERAGYGHVAGQLFRREIWIGPGTLSEHLSAHQTPHRYRTIDNHPARRYAPDLWTAARIERRRVAALTRHAASSYMTPSHPGQETHAACGDRGPTAQRDCAGGSREGGHV